MKKKKLKSLVKSAIKKTRKDLKLSLIIELKELASKFGQDSKKINRGIEKGSKQLAKKLSKNFRIDKTAMLEAGNGTEAANVLETPKTITARKPRKAYSRAAEPSTGRHIKSKVLAKPVAIQNPSAEPEIS